MSPEIKDICTLIEGAAKNPVQNTPTSSPIIVQFQSVGDQEKSLKTKLLRK